MSLGRITYYQRLPCIYITISPYSSHVEDRPWIERELPDFGCWEVQGVIGQQTMN